MCITLIININAFASAIGQSVVLRNPENARQTVAFNKVNGRWGLEEFHGAIMPKFLFKVDVATMHTP